MVVDDYNWFSGGVKAAVNEFTTAHPSYAIKIFDANYDHFAILKRS